MFYGDRGAVFFPQEIDIDKCLITGATMPRERPYVGGVLYRGMTEWQDWWTYRHSSVSVSRRQYL